jgi:hypothetical protein
MKRSSGPRKIGNLSESVHRQLNMYALAASATGVSVLALAQPVGAKIVYTPADVKISPNNNFNLDLNHDGTTDFTFTVYAYRQTGSGYYAFRGSMLVGGAQTSNAVVVGAKGLARAFGHGITIGPKLTVAREPFMAHCEKIVGPKTYVHTSIGNWLNVQNRYLGLKFNIDGKIHYGWARLTTSVCGLDDTLTGYAYETIPNKPVVTGRTKGTDDAEPVASFNTRNPEPATLEMLALGAPKLAIWRREESVIAAPNPN